MGHITECMVVFAMSVGLAKRHIKGAHKQGRVRLGWGSNPAPGGPPSRTATNPGAHPILLGNLFITSLNEIKAGVVHLDYSLQPCPVISPQS